MSEKEYNKCVDDFADMVFKYLKKNLFDSISAEDLVQDTFAALWQNHRQVDFQKAKAYIFITAHNFMVNNNKYIAKTDRLKTMLRTGDNSYCDKTLEYNDLIDAIVENLEGTMRECLTLRDIHGFAYKEIAEVLDISEANVKTLIFRARVKIKETIIKLGIER